MAQQRRFTPEFKRQAVQLLNAGQRPAAKIARALDIPRNRLYKWQKDVAGHGGAWRELTKLQFALRSSP
jgi:transposase